MLLDLAHDELAWPSPAEIMDPPGAGPRMYAQLAKRKLENTLRHTPNGNGAQVGVLAGDPRTSHTEAPLSIVCSFPRAIEQNTLRTCLEVAWSFCRSPLLITAEPQLLRAWSCYETPARRNETTRPAVCEARADTHTGRLVQDAAARALHWVELATGSFIRKHEDRFPERGRADHSLIRNLTEVRSRLYNENLRDYDIIHDLLARIIFVQFLFHRKDSAGTPALHAGILERLHEDGHLSDRYTALGEILTSHSDTYALFRWLNDRFNGDLFPGKGATPEERDGEWHREMDAVSADHLRSLARFVDGELDLGTGQYSLWPLYSFDAIPLELISSIYEEFTTKGSDSSDDTVHYTPSHLVDFMLDGVLSWDDDRWNLKVLDPSCGSGIFLVKAFQRLIHRWRNAHPGQNPSAETLQALLERNLLGVDINREAVRVASFSLYLAMCDEIDPRDYWNRVHFPRMRGRRLIDADFFQEDVEGFRTHEDANTYDLVVGNAPWGRDSMTPLAAEWVKKHPAGSRSGRRAPSLWEPPNNQIGTLFLPKAAMLAKENALVAMLQPAGALLFNRQATALRFRQRLFTTYTVDEIVDLSALRFVLFPKAVSPCCAVVLHKSQPSGDPIAYYAPKQSHTCDDLARIVIEPHDLNEVDPQQAASDPLVWSVLAWGGKRDMALVAWLARQRSLSQIPEERRRKGLVRGDRKHEQPELLERRTFASRDLPKSADLRVDPQHLPQNPDARVDSGGARRLTPFTLPQLIIRKAWSVDPSRFRAVLLDAVPGVGGVVCSQSFISVVNPDDPSLLEAACLSYNSIVALYYLLLTSGRFASYRPEPLLEDFLRVPIPSPRAGLLEGIATFDDIDVRAREAFGLKDAEWALIEDLAQITLPDFKGGPSSPGRQPTRRGPVAQNDGLDEPDLRTYCDYFIRVLRAGFGQEKAVCATIYGDADHWRLPLRMVAIHLDWPSRDHMVVEQMGSHVVLERLQQLNERYLSLPGTNGPSIFYQRVARVYSAFEAAGRQVPTIYVTKPDQRRYWTRSMAMRDADEVAADILTWRDSAPVPSVRLEDTLRG